MANIYGVDDKGMTHDYCQRIHTDEQPCYKRIAKALYNYPGVVILTNEDRIFIIENKLIDAPIVDLIEQYLAENYN